MSLCFGIPQRRLALLMIALGMISGFDSLLAQQPSVVPAPLQVVASPGTLRVASGAVISYPRGDAASRFAAEHLADLVKHTVGLELVVKASSTSRPADATIVLLMQPTPSAPETQEAYDLDVSPQRVTITAAHAAGLYYGTVTLWQLLTATPHRGAVTLGCEHLQDAPQMSWRGIMLDSARHMQSIEYVRQLIDWMSLEKLNVLHWHLTDDQGWRLEIKRYPKLTSVGGFRELPSQVGQTDPVTRKPYPKYGGFYTQEQVRSLVAYAAARHVMIVPEIEMPGHATAALAAYPEYGASDVRLASPASDYGVFPSLYNVDDATFTFLENILTEVMALFPSAYIHVGGDEAIKPQWKASAKIQAQMKALDVKNEDELQSYFIKRIDTFLTSHQRRTLGWDEILDGGLAPNATVMSWHGVKGGIDAAKQGHDAVLTPVRPLYFNSRESDAVDEPPARFSVNSLEDVYKFDPQPKTLTDEERKHILGVQANVWTEYVITDDRVTQLLYPRTAALAEIGWSAPSRRDWKDFSTRMVAEFGRYRALGLGFNANAFRVRSSETLDAAKREISVALANQVGLGTIRYTTDGSAASADSAKYETPLMLPLPTKLRAAAFLDSSSGVAIPGSEVERLYDDQTVRRRYSQELRMCANDPVIGMEQDPAHGARSVMLANYKNPCWIYRGADLSGVAAVSAQAATLPYVFQDVDGKSPALGVATTQHGELEVRLDTCSGDILATLPLPGTTRFDVLTTLHGAVRPMSGKHDLCVKVVRPELNPLWVLNWIQLEVQAPK